MLALWHGGTQCNVIVGKERTSPSMTSPILTLDKQQPNLFLSFQPAHHNNHALHATAASTFNTMEPKSTSRMATLLRYTSRGNIFFFAAFAGGYALNEYLKSETAKKIPLAREPGSEEEVRK
jgi:hypothetical protein